MLELTSVYKSFRHNGNLIEVLKGVDLTVDMSESIAVMGASGVGKSTLLSIMGTLERPTGGVVRFDGKNIHQMDEMAMCKLRNQDIGFIFQFHHLLPELNALENTIMPLLIARRRKKEASGKAEEILKKVGLEKRLHHRIGELSGGEQQRVAVARALVTSPKLLLADEPTGNLDKNTGDGIVDLLLWLNREDKLAIVIATHDWHLAKRMSRQMEIIDGHLQ